MYEIIRTDRTNGATIQVAHDLPSAEKAAELLEVLRSASWLHTIARGTVARFGYRVKEQAR